MAKRKESGKQVAAQPAMAQETIDPLDHAKKLYATFFERAARCGYTGKRRDELLLEFFTGAAVLSEQLYTMDGPLTIILLKVCMYVISLRREKGLREYLGIKEPHSGNQE